MPTNGKAEAPHLGPTHSLRPDDCIADQGRRERRISEMYMTSNSAPPARRPWWRRFIDRFTRDGEYGDE